MKERERGEKKKEREKEREREREKKNMSNNKKKFGPKKRRKEPKSCAKHNFCRIGFDEKKCQYCQEVQIIEYAMCSECPTVCCQVCFSMNPKVVTNPRKVDMWC